MQCKRFITNFKVPAEDIENMFEAAEYNNEFEDVAGILMHINDKLIE